MGEFIYNNNNNNGKKWFFLKIIIIIFWLVWKDRGRLVWSLWSLDQQHGNWNVKGLGECAIRYKPIGKTAKEYLRCDINYVEWVLLIFFSSFYLNIFDVMLNGIMDIYIYIYFEKCWMDLICLSNCKAEKSYDKIYMNGSLRNYYPVLDYIG